MWGGDIDGCRFAVVSYTSRSTLVFTNLAVIVTIKDTMFFTKKSERSPLEDFYLTKLEHFFFLCVEKERFNSLLVESQAFPSPLMSRLDFG